MDASSVALLIEGGAILLCIVLSGLFSGSETAFTSLREVRQEQLLQERVTGHRLLLLWRNSPSVVLSFLLVANNLVNILASSLATDITLRLFGDGSWRGFALAGSVGAMTLLVLIFGEVVPKTYARHNPRILVAALPALMVFYVLLWPLARLFSLLGRSFISLMGGDPTHSTQPAVTEEELEYLLHRGRAEGSLDVDKERMLSGVLGLEDRIAKEVMVPRTECVMFESRTSLSEAMTVISETKFSRFPVYQGEPDKVLGVFYAKDLLDHFNAQGKPVQAFKLRNIVHPPYFVPETKKLDELLKEFREEHIHMAIVVDEYGGTAGIVTLEDIIEEMVGEIYDEYDEKEEAYQRIDESTFVVDSRLPVDDLREELLIPVHVPEGREYETVGGLVLDLAGSVPGVGQEFRYQSEDPASPALTLEVMEGDGVKISKVLIKIVPSAPVS